MSDKKAPISVRDLEGADYNPRKITDARLGNLGRMMKKFGDISGVVFNARNGRLVCGHQRCKNLDKNARVVRLETFSRDEFGTIATGYIEDRDKGRIAYREVDWDEQMHKAAMMAANNNAGQNDAEKATALLEDLIKGGFDVTLTGFDEKEMDELLAGGAKDAKVDEDEVVEPDTIPAVTKPGDLWILGKHRLLCGDSTKRDDVKTLMGGGVANCVFTDPPYGVSYKAKSGKFEIIENDDKTADALLGLLVPMFQRAAEVATDAAAWYVWHASSTREEFAQAIKAAGLMERQYLIWAKNGIVLGHSDYRWAHEPCFYASKQGSKPAFYGGRDQPTVWRVALRTKAAAATMIGQGVVIRDGKGSALSITTKTPKGKKIRAIRLEQGSAALLFTEHQEQTVWEVGHDRDYVHPTQKPVELARRAIQNSTLPEQTVLDLCGGSGSTLIGCEATGRHARLMEIDPKYCDAIVRRWENYTGKVAERQPNTAKEIA
jgi:DNA modification methylase